MDLDSGTPIRLAIVGCGAIAEQMHIPAIRAVDRVRLVSVIDSDGMRAEATAKKHGVPHYATSVLDVASKVDAVILCTPPHVRPRVARQAFEAGLHVLCEKPLANSVEECDQIIQDAERAGRVLAVAHIFRFWPSRQAVRQVIESQEFGAIRSVTATQGNPYSWATVSGYNMRPGLVPGGVLFDAGIHPLDTLLWWFGKPSHVKYEDDSLGGLESNVRLVLEYESGVSVRFRQSRTSTMTNEFLIEFENAMVTLSNYSAVRFQIRQNGRTENRQVATEEGAQQACEQNQLLDFVDSITDGRPPAVTGAASRDVIELVHRCYAQRVSRKRVECALLPGLTF